MMFWIAFKRDYDSVRYEGVFCFWDEGLRGVGKDLSELENLTCYWMSITGK